MAKVRLLFNGASRAVVIDEAVAMQFVKNGEAVILGTYRVAVASPYNKAVDNRPEKGHV